MYLIGVPLLPAIPAYFNYLAILDLQSSKVSECIGEIVLNKRVSDYYRVREGVNLRLIVDSACALPPQNIL